MSSNASFKIGDRVKLTQISVFENGYIGLNAGDIGTVAEPEKNQILTGPATPYVPVPSIAVVLDKKIRSYEDNNSRMFFVNCLELVNPAVTTVPPVSKRSHTRKPLQIGDTVVVVRIADGGTEQQDLEDVYGRIGQIVNTEFGMDVKFPGWNGGCGLHHDRWYVIPRQLIRVRKAKK